MSGDHLFVYGTLRSSGDKKMYDFLSSNARFVGKGYIRGMLYEVDGYPGAVLTGGKDDKVYGEVFELYNSKKVFAVLDEYEECSDNFPHPHEYRRVCVDVYMEDGNIIKAWMYEYNHDVDELHRIRSGDYMLYVKEKEGV